MKKMRWLIGIVAVVGIAFAVGACTGGSEEQAAPPPSDVVVAGDGKASVGVGLDETGSVTAAPAPAEAAPPAEVAPEVDLGRAEEIDVIPLPEVGPKVIQVATLSLSVERGRFNETVDRARTIAAGLGGFVTASSASQGTDQRLVRGSLVVRVPQRSYAQAMARLAELGRVTGREESGQDVSQQYVDLEARERHLEAVERQLLGFLSKTETVADALIVQDRLNQVQLQLEEVRGQLRYLDDQTSFSTITLNVAERGVPVAGGKDGGWGITDAWQTAADGFLKVIGAVFVGLATAGPILAALALAFLGGRWWLRRRRPAGPDAGETVPRPTPQA
jgi:hypothetical protein